MAVPVVDIFEIVIHRPAQIHRPCESCRFTCSNTDDYRYPSGESGIKPVIQVGNGIYEFVLSIASNGVSSVTLSPSQGHTAPRPPQCTLTLHSILHYLQIRTLPSATSWQMPWRIYSFRIFYPYAIRHSIRKAPLCDLSIAVDGAFESPGHIYQPYNVKYQFQFIYQ